ncbi:MAG TPA: tyrosine--tRNA ligase [Pirellulaceae bacterium]|nr:tyrosine--tRNA ligase [Pirellulaceae bacterium]
MATDIISELKWRGLVHQMTDETTLASWLMAKPRTVYAGFDPTADSLHVGSLLPLVMLRRFQLAGHRPIAVVGGATGMIGDPSGKSAERNLLSREQLEVNLRGIESQIRKLLVCDGPLGAIVVNNIDWTASMSCVEFLRDIGKNVPIAVMLAKDSVRSRLAGESGMSYTEFSYMLLQAYDFVHLHRTYQCEMQIGGSDQWGNITAGIDLARRMDGATLQGLTCPLLTKADGSKMGKTESGTVWLDAQRTSPFAFYQYWINVADEDAGKCLRFLTDCPREEIEALDRSRGAEPQARASQQRLAESLTVLIHGPSGLAKAQMATQVLFGAEIDQLSDSDLLQIFADVPSAVASWAELDQGQLTLVDGLVRAGLVGSKNEARRAIGEGSVAINNRKSDDAVHVLSRRDLASETTIVLRRGKKKYALLKFQ